MREKDQVIQVTGRNIVIKIETGSMIGTEIETWNVKDLGNMKLEVIEIGEGEWILGRGMEKMGAETGITIGADHVRLYGIITEGLEVQFAPISGISR